MGQFVAASRFVTTLLCRVLCAVCALRCRPPCSVNYGKYMTSEEVTALTAAKPEAVSATMAFFKDASCVNMGDALKCTGTVAVLSALLETKFFTVLNVGADVNTQSVVSHIGPMSIPSSLAEHVEFITGLSFFPEQRLGRAHPVKERGPDDDDPSTDDYTVRLRQEGGGGLCSWGVRCGDLLEHVPVR